ncbi:MAG: acyltransferase, partial [Fibrella sp.]|nr:acyltransferase [Armatimonadota bacterium]
MKEPQKRTYASFDMWRGLLAIWVVLFHCVSNTQNDYANVIRGSGFVDFLLWSGLRVPMFFVISGYCMSAAAANLIDRDHTVGRFAVARIRRIYPPHLAALMIGFGVAGLFWLVQQLGYIQDNPTVAWFTKITAWDIAVNAMLLQVPLRLHSLNDVTWTLCYEVAFYAVIAVAIFAFRKQGWHWVLKALHVVTLLALLTTVLAPKWVLFPFDHWIGFGEGVLLFDLLCGRPWKERSRKGKALYG